MHHTTYCFIIYTIIYILVGTEGKIIMDDELSPVDTSMPPGMKRGPGRPPKKAVKTIIPHQGILLKPSNAVNVTSPDQLFAIELVYDNPIMFRRLFGIYFNMKVTTLRVRFSHDLLEMHGVDHFGVSHLYNAIPGKAMNRYYCETPVEFGINVKALFDVIKSIAPETSRIQLTARRANVGKKLKITTTQDVIADQNEEEIDVESVPEYDWKVKNEVALEMTYAIQFELPFKYFKRKIMDFSKNNCDLLRVRKTEASPLHFHYEYSNRTGTSNTYYRKPELIKLKTKLSKGEIFNVGFHITHVHEMVSCCSVAEYIGISCNKNSPIIFTIVLDSELDNKKPVAGTEHCVIKILTNSGVVKPAA